MENIGEYQLYFKAKKDSGEKFSASLEEITKGLGRF